MQGKMVWMYCFGRHMRARRWVSAAFGRPLLAYAPASDNRARVKRRVAGLRRTARKAALMRAHGKGNEHPEPFPFTEGSESTVVHEGREILRVRNLQWRVHFAERAASAS